jgi:hypothetical protein
LVTVEAGEKGDAGGVALGGVVELGEAEAVVGERVEVGSIDFGAVAAEIGEAEVIGHDEDDIGGRHHECLDVFEFEIPTILGRGGKSIKCQKSSDE